MSLALPGQALGSSDKHTPGQGTHIFASQVCASVLGETSISPVPQGQKKGAKSQILPTLSVASLNTTASSYQAGGTAILPEVDSIVLARVVRLQQRQAVVEILVINDTVCRGTFAGLIRREDVRATEKDRVKIVESFRIGDIVRGVVISLGDQANYYLSTARNDLGVMMAMSEEGNVCYPVSWKEVADSRTGKRETRKVAKPF